MKTSTIMRPIAVTAVALTVSAWHQASAGILILVDITSPDAVVFTTTNEFSQVDSSNTTFESGITLLDLFDESAIALFTRILGSQISPSLSSQSYNTYSAFSTDFNLTGNPQEGNEFDIQSFATDAIALTGSSTLDLQGFSITAGRTGDIVIFEGEVSEGLTIGQWQTVPEPSGAFLALGGSLGLLLRRRRSARGMAVFSQ